MGENHFNFENPFENIHCKKLPNLPFKIANLHNLGYLNDLVAVLLSVGEAVQLFFIIF